MKVISFICSLLDFQFHFKVYVHGVWPYMFEIMISMQRPLPHDQQPPRRLLRRGRRGGPLRGRPQEDGQGERGGRGQGQRRGPRERQGRARLQVGAGHQGKKNL